MLFSAKFCSMETDHSRWSTEPGGGRWETPGCWRSSWLRQRRRSPCSSPTEGRFLSWWSTALDPSLRDRDKRWALCFFFMKRWRQNLFYFKTEEQMEEYSVTFSQGKISFLNVHSGRKMTSLCLGYLNSWSWASDDSLYTICRCSQWRTWLQLSMWGSLPQSQWKQQ